MRSKVGGNRWVSSSVSRDLMKGENPWNGRTETPNPSYSAGLIISVQCEKSL